MSEPKRIMIREVIGAAAAVAGVDQRALMARKSCDRLAPYRKAAYAAARICTGRTWPALGHHFGRDHSTLIYGARTADPKIVAQIAERLGA